MRITCASWNELKTKGWNLGLCWDVSVEVWGEWYVAHFFLSQGNVQSRDEVYEKDKPPMLLSILLRNVAFREHGL